MMNIDHTNLLKIESFRGSRFEYNSKNIRQGKHDKIAV
jgi:hypothetical protein